MEHAQRSETGRIIGPIEAVRASERQERHELEGRAEAAAGQGADLKEQIANLKERRERGRFCSTKKRRR
jgi:hypothetical protein